MLDNYNDILNFDASSVLSSGISCNPALTLLKTQKIKPLRLDAVENPKDIC